MSLALELALRRYTRDENERLRAVLERLANYPLAKDELAAKAMAEIAKTALENK